jgi:hypothetical protein
MTNILLSFTWSTAFLCTGWIIFLSKSVYGLLLSTGLCSQYRKTRKAHYAHWQKTVCTGTNLPQFKNKHTNKHIQLCRYRYHTSRIQIPFPPLDRWVLGCQPLIRPAKALSREHHTGFKM